VGSCVLESPSSVLELLIPEEVLLQRASEVKLSPTLDDRNIGEVNALPGVILTQALFINRTRPFSCAL